MSSLRDRFATLDGMAVPELWSDVERRAEALGAADRLTSVAARVPVRTTRSSDRMLALLVAALLVVLLAGAVAVGSGLVRLPAVVPAPVPSPSSLSLAPTPASSSGVPSTTPRPSGPAAGPSAPWVVFRRDVASAASIENRGQVWAIRSDGRSARQILAANYAAVAWSRDGTRLLLDDGTIRVGPVANAFGPFTDTGLGARTNSQWEGFDFAPDGQRVVFMNKSKCPTAAAPFGVSVAETAGANCMVLSILDLRTGKRVDLDETLVKDQTRNQNLSLELPVWSPDGTKIAYSRVDEPRDTRELWVVDADGSRPSKVAMDADVSVQEPRWSPDGTRISFTSQTWLSDSVSDSAVYVVDLASGRLERVTTGSDAAAGQLCCADWIDNARLRVEGAPEPTNRRFWTVALDPAPHDAQVLADLTDALAAINPPGYVSMVSAPGDPGRTFFWQPVHVSQP